MTVSDESPPLPRIEEMAGTVAVIWPMPLARSRDPLPETRVEVVPGAVSVAETVKATLLAAAESDAEAARLPLAAPGVSVPEAALPDPPAKAAAPTATAATSDAATTATPIRRWDTDRSYRRTTWHGGPPR